ncbi:MAG: LPXTG cell wall anchor domain-containing protein, partial [Pseudolactococcus laudensis]
VNPTLPTQPSKEQAPVVADQTSQPTQAGNTSATQKTDQLPETGESNSLLFKLLGGLIVLVLLGVVYSKKETLK